MTAVGGFFATRKKKPKNNAKSLCIVIFRENFYPLTMAFFRAKGSRNFAKITIFIKIAKKAKAKLICPKNGQNWRPAGRQFLQNSFALPFLVKNEVSLVHLHFWPKMYHREVI